jgi:phosphate transport system substrate-binding protein
VRTRRLLTGAVAAFAAASLVVASCGGDDDAGGGAGGGITVDGSSTVAPITEAIAEEFRNEQPDVAVTVGTSGTGGGFTRFCADEIDIADASRPIKDEEVEACEAAGIEYTELLVGLDGLAIVTSADNTFLECLSIEQLAAIFEEGGARTWDQVDPSFPRSRVEIFAPGTDSGTYDFFVDEVLGDVEARTDYTASEDDNTLVQGLSGEANSWGFFGFAYFKENAKVLKALQVAGESGECVEPSDETVVAGEYPLSRPLYLYVNDEALERPEVVDFVRFYLETTPNVIRDVGYTAAQATEYDKGLQAIGVSS